MDNFTAEDVQRMQGGASSAQQSAPAQQQNPPPVTHQAPPDNQRDQQQSSQAPGQQAAATDQDVEVRDLPPGIDNYDQLVERLQRYEQLEQEVQLLNEYKNGPKFRSPRSKLIYDYAERAEGYEPEAAMNMLQVATMDLSKMDDQQIRYESFRREYTGKGLSEGKIKTLFAAKETREFGNLADEANPPTEDQKIQAELATIEAKAKLSKLQSEWNEARTAEQSPEEIAAQSEKAWYAIQSELEDFDGIQLDLSGTDAKGEKLASQLNFVVDEERQRVALLSACHDPLGWWDDMLDKHGVVGDNNETNYKAFADLITRIEFAKEISHRAYQQGLNDSMSNQLKTARNVGDPSFTGDSNSSGGAVDPNKDVIRSAMKAAGMAVPV